MIDAIRKAPGRLTQILAGYLLSSRAQGGTLHDLDEVTPWIAAANVPDPQVRLTGAIMLLFVGGLSLLAVGYVIDSIRSDNPPVR